MVSQQKPGVIIISLQPKGEPLADGEHLRAGQGRTRCSASTLPLSLPAMASGYSRSPLGIPTWGLSTTDPRSKQKILQAAATPQEIARVVRHLVSDDFAYMVAHHWSSTEGAPGPPETIWTTGKSSTTLGV